MWGAVKEEKGARLRGLRGSDRLRLGFRNSLRQRCEGLLEVEDLGSPWEVAEVGGVPDHRGERSHPQGLVAREGRGRGSAQDSQISA